MPQKNIKITPAPGVKKYGFSLIELLVVMAIIGILASVIMVTLGSAGTKAVTARAEVFEGSMYDGFASDALAIWNFDEGPGAAGTNRLAADSSGNHSDITLDPEAFSSDWPAPWASSSDAFRGNSALTFANNSVPTPGSTTIAGFDPANGSISFWIRLKQAPGNGVFCNNSGNIYDMSSFAQFCIMDSGATGKFIGAFWNGGSAGNNLESNIDPVSVLNTWSHVALSWNIPSGSPRGTMEMYINGKEAASSSTYVLPSRLTPPYSFCIGGDCHEDDIIGSIDEMRVYSRSLQIGEVEKLYAEGSGRHGFATEWQ